MLDFPKVEVINDQIFTDQRGYFIESYNKNFFDRKIGRSVDFVQDNLVFSRKNVFRGLHFQSDPYAQSKLVRVLKGKIVDITLDIRVGSDKFLSWESFVLEEGIKQSLFVPDGYAHGYCVLSDEAEVIYKVSSSYSKKNEKFISINNNDIKPNISNYLKNQFNVDYLVFSKKDQKIKDDLIDLKI